jgi:hypothetical protein
MKKYLLSILALLILTACTQQNTPQSTAIPLPSITTSSPESTTKTFTNEMYKYSYTYPNTWYLQGDNQSQQLSDKVDDSEKHNTIVTIYTLGKDEQVIKTSEPVGTAKKTFKKTKSVEMDTHRASVLETAPTAQNPRTVRYEIDLNERILVFQFNDYATGEEKATNTKYFEGIINSIKFTE